MLDNPYLYAAVKEVISKIINDPVYGFIHIPFQVLFDLIEHPFFQRLRRIRQLGLTHLVYPGAQHTRFQHSLGALHLMNSAIAVLREKGIIISEKEAEAVSIAILLHDIGHGPFSHTLEHSLVEGINHEDLSILFMEQLNEEFGGKLDLAIRIFKGQYDKKFLHQLVSGQLDMDRLDYLKRDSFFTGVTEGTIGLDRIIEMINVKNDQLVVDEKGIYSIEKFLIARRLMYWQVYLHKTVLSAELLLMKILKRAKELTSEGVSLFVTSAMKYFLEQNINYNSVFGNNPNHQKVDLLKNFACLDDNDILTSAKIWAEENDIVLSLLCKRLLNRYLFRAKLQKEKFDDKLLEGLYKKVMKEYKIPADLTSYFVFMEVISNYAYDPDDHSIQIFYKDGSLRDISEASDILNTSVLSKTIKKYCLCYPKELEILNYK
ncbi:MAG: HD domain-containing protein [Bacteroidota bacterium]|nr:HD domain-containing protein [Bacteroidota bacterium]